MLVSELGTQCWIIYKMASEFVVNSARNQIIGATDGYHNWGHITPNGYTFD